MMWLTVRNTAVLVLLGCASTLASGPPEGVFRDDFSGGLAHWRPYWEAEQWTAADGLLRNEGKTAESVLLADPAPARDVVVEADVRIGDAPAASFGLVLRAEGALTFLLLGYSNQEGTLGLYRYRLGVPGKVRDAAHRTIFAPGRWYRIKAAAIDDMVLGKMWPVDAAEPEWQLRAPSGDSGPGGVGVMTLDASAVEFRDFQVRSGPAMSDLADAWQRERQAYEAHLREVLRLDVSPTPLVLRSDDGPMRRIDIRALADGEPALVGGELSAVCGESRQAHKVSKSDLVKGTYQLLIPEPAEAVDLAVTLATSIGRTVEARCRVQPARRWTFYMTEHTHYDIGFTAPQPIVMEQLSRDMDTIAGFVEHTADWPEASRFKWTIEVSGLLRNYIERHSDEEVTRMMDLIRRGSVEVCGYYLNMPTELVGHEELIRCLYYAQELRDRYGVQIDTAMIDDVPGYTWALPEVFVEAGIPRVSFRANSIRGQFLWYREGLPPRPFYWESPDGTRLFTWYTDSYREGNFWRNPGLQEESFIRIIRQNEAAGCWVDDIQLRMGGDNLAPDLDVSENARAWNARYLWPRTVVATNRDFLEQLEKRYGAQCETVRGDIPSWWAEGPASTALETGMNRLTQDRLVAAEALWALAWLADPQSEFPTDMIRDAYDGMIHYDEHTWGSSKSFIEPKGRSTRVQWEWKARYAHRADELAHRLLADALERLGRRIAAPASHSVAVWNTLAWSRTDVVDLSLIDTPFAGVDRLAVTDTRSGDSVPVQVTDYGTRALFVARDLPAMGYVVFSIARTAAPSPEVPLPEPGGMENEFHRLVFSPEHGSLTSWYDKRLGRELLDREAAYGANQAVHEVPLGGRLAINRKRPVEFERSAAVDGRLVERRAGPVFQELTCETSLPGCPSIRQTVRLYHELAWLDIINVVTKEEVFDPEGVYFAFPFDVPAPDIRLQIADAIMRPGKDQLLGSCHDFHSIQQWADVSGEGFGIIFAPLEAPLVVVSDMNVYKWADRLTFDKGHLYSLVTNNYWFTNFKAMQSGEIPFRYRLTSYAGDYDPVRTTQLAWQPFHPLLASWLPAASAVAHSAARPAIALEGDPVIVSCIKRAESGDALIVRLLEMRGRPARCTLVLEPGTRIAGAQAATVLEVPASPLPVAGNKVTCELRPHEIFTARIVPGR